MRKAKPLAKIIREANPQQAPLLTERQMEGIKTAGGIILAAVAVGGTLALAVAAPNIFTAIDRFYKMGKGLSKKQKERLVSQRLSYLKKSGKIAMKESLGETIVSLTRLGQKHLEEQLFDTLTIPRPRHWTRRWWQVAADIPTKSHRAAADALRYKLKSMGFYPLQKTLWYYPYDPRRELQYIIDRFDVAKFVTIMEIHRLDKTDETLLRKHFKNSGVM